MEQLCGKKIVITQFLKSVAAVNPAKLLMESLRINEGKLHVCDKVFDLNENIYLVGFGKAVLGMASQCEKILGKHLKHGVICGPENIQETFANNSEYSLKPGSVIELYEGAKNNLPDANSERGTDAVIKLLKSLNHKTDGLIVLISGGGSALLAKPKPSITLSEKLDTINLLFSSGADIGQVNTVRKKLSLVKGGGLAHLSYPVKTISLIISDVINDPLDIIASGPTVPNCDKNCTAFDILQNLNLTNKVSGNVLNKIKEISSETNVSIIKDSYTHVDNFIIGNNKKALNAAKQFSETDFGTLIMSAKVKGLVDIVANFYIMLLFEILSCLHSNGHKLINKENLFRYCSFEIENNFVEELNKKIIELKDGKGICVLAGGETTVKVQGSGKGGRNQELVLMVCVKLHEMKMRHPDLFNKYDVTFLSAGTDGADGPTDAAGAVGNASVIEKAERSNLDANKYLKENDSYNFFSKFDNGSYLIKTGHTGTNVMDIHSLLISNRQFS